MSFLNPCSKYVGSPQRLFTYEIPGQKIGAGKKQRNVPVWAIIGQYSTRHVFAGHPSVLCAQNDADQPSLANPAVTILSPDSAMGTYSEIQ